MSSLTCSQISCQGKSFEARQAAGLLLKNNLRATFSSMPPASQQYVKSELLPCIGATNKAIRSIVGTVISVLFQIVRVAGWIELFQALHQCLDSNDLDHMEGAMDAIYKVNFSLIFLSLICDFHIEDFEQLVSTCLSSNSVANL